MDSKIVDHLLAGVEYERTRKGSPHVLREERRKNFNQIRNGDLQFVAQIQESVGSRGFHGAALNYQERRIYHWHEELDRRIGVERVPEHLRVARLRDSRVTESWR